MDRSRRRALALLAAALAPAACADEAPSPVVHQAAEDITARHVVVISMDTTRADHFGFLGNPHVQTPHLDALAAESVVFDDYMTVTPTTLSSHTSLFTGRYPHFHGVPFNGMQVSPANATMAEILAANGFHTAGFAASFALDGRFGIAQGFAHYDQEYAEGARTDGSDQNHRVGALVTDAAITYLERGVPDRLFLFAHYFDAHAPYEPPETDALRYDPLGSQGLLPFGAAEERKRLPAEAQRQQAERQMLHYAGEITYMDRQIGRLLDHLREQGLLDDALVIVTTDHGETFLEHTEPFDHGREVYQTTIHGVGLIRLPGGVLGGTRVAAPVASIDVLPTTLAYLGLDVPAKVDGVPIDLDALDQLDGSRLLFGQANKPGPEVETDPRWANLPKARFVRRGRYKLIQTPYRETEELYDLAQDPDEQVDLLREPTEDARRIAGELGPALTHWAESARPLPSSEAFALDHEVMRRLRALGYVR